MAGRAVGRRPAVWTEARDPLAAGDGGAPEGLGLWAVPSAGAAVVASLWSGGGVRLFEAEVDGSFPVGLQFENRLNLPRSVYRAGVSTAQKSPRRTRLVNNVARCWGPCGAFSLNRPLSLMHIACFSRTLIKNEIVIEKLMIFRRRKMKSELL